MVQGAGSSPAPGSKSKNKTMLTLALTSKKFEGQILFKYNLNGYLISFEVQAELDEAQLLYFYKLLPWTKSKLYSMQSLPGNEITITEIPADLSFEVFWNRYNNKVGKKNKVKQIWENLPEATRVKVLVSITYYNQWLVKTGFAKCYPETYLNQERYENEYR